jgi:hypothetical protein
VSRRAGVSGFGGEVPATNAQLADPGIRLLPVKLSSKILSKAGAMRVCEGDRAIPRTEAIAFTVTIIKFTSEGRLQNDRR